MEFIITRDMDEVRALMTIRPCYVRMGDDSKPRVDEFKIKNPDSFIAVMAKGPKGTEAAFLIFPSDSKTAEIHFTFAPAAWGRTKTIARGFLQWVWDNTTLERLIGPVPNFNRLALQLAQGVGFKQYDVQVGVGKRHGHPFDRIMLERLRPAQGAAQNA